MNAAGKRPHQDNKTTLDDGAVTPSCGPWRDQIAKLLNDSLATELVCILPTTRRLLEDILRDGEEHADEMADLLAGT